MFIARELNERMCRRLFLLIFAAMLCVSTPALAQGRFVRPHGAYGAVPLDRILPHIRSRHPGTFSDVDGPFADPDGRLHYRIKWLTPEGRVIWLDTDARTGRVLGINRGWGRHGPYPRPHFGPPRGMPEGPPPGRYRGRTPWMDGPPPGLRGHGPGWHGGRGRRGR